MILRNNLRYFFAAISLHLILLLVFCFNRTDSTNHMTTVLPIYIAAASERSQPFHAFANTHTIKVPLKKLIKQNKTPSSKQQFISLQHVSIEKNQLLLLLHTSIAQKQIYPDTAKELGQTGTVTVSFQINPNGFISHLTLLHSSGFENLDQAALTAVRAISPVNNVQDYLKTTMNFTIDIIFAE